MDWNQRYADGDTPWDKGAAAPPLQELLQLPEAARWFGDRAVIVPGCGSGHDVRLIAAHLDNPVIGLDIAPLAIERARTHSSAGNIHYLCADWFEYAHEGPPPSAVFEHTCFCAIDPDMRAEYVSTAARILPAGSHLVGVFFLNTGDDEGPPWPSSVTGLRALFEPFFELCLSRVPSDAYPGREGCELSMVWRRKSRV